MTPPSARVQRHDEKKEKSAVRRPPGERKPPQGMELVAQPLLLFADEPTSGLDSTTSHEAREIPRLRTGRNPAIFCARAKGGQGPRCLFLLSPFFVGFFFLFLGVFGLCASLFGCACRWFVGLLSESKRGYHQEMTPWETGLQDKLSIWFRAGGVNLVDCTLGIVHLGSVLWQSVWNWTCSCPIHDSGRNGSLQTQGNAQCLHGVEIVVPANPFRPGWTRITAV